MIEVRPRYRGRLLAAVSAIILFGAAVPAAADIRDLLGRPIVSVRVEVAGVPYGEPSVLQLFETRVGEPFSMERVRESVDHLVGLGRFEDVRVFADAEAAGAGGVAVRWVLVPVQRISAIEIEENSAYSAAALRAAISDRAGVSPPTSRVAEIEQLVGSFLAERGYRHPVLSTKFSPGKSPELVTLHLRVEAGPRTTIQNVTVTGDGAESSTAALEDLNIDRGRPYDRPAIDARVESFENELREKGYYEADVEITPSFAEAEPLVDIAIEVRRGSRVSVVFAGDPLPANRRDTLVPIRQERSVDLDLLEDASRNIDSFLREQGYRTAETSYVREDKGGDTVLTFTVKSGPLHRLTSLDVSGNVAVPRAAIAPLLGLEPGEPFADVRVNTVASAITELYRVRGFTAASVKPEVRILPTEQENPRQVRLVEVRLLVSEGPQTTVGDVAISGASLLSEASVRPSLGLAPGRPFYRPQLDADRNAIERLFRNEGFQAVRVEPRTVLKDEGRRVDLQWTIAEGPRAVIDRVLISGNERTSAELIRREIVLKPGAPLGEDAVIESQRRLAALGLFRRVRIVELPHGASLTRDVLIDVEEAPPTTIGYGGGIEAGRRLRTGDGSLAEERIDVAPRGFFEVSRRNLWGKNRVITLFTRVSLRPRDPGNQPEDVGDVGGYGLNEYRVVGTFQEPRPFNRQGDAQMTAFVEQAIRSSFNFRRRGIRAEYGRRFSNVGISGRYSFDRTRLFDTQLLPPEDELNIDRLFPQVRLSTLTGSLLRDSRSDPVDPAGGTLIGTDVSFALRALGSQVGFVKSFSQGFIYRRVRSTAFTFVAGARLGVAAGLASVIAGGTVIDDVPASERFFAGGDTTVRGFVLDRLGTADTLNAAGFPTGGRGLVVLNGELRSPYWKGLGAVGFVDAGNVFRDATDITLAELRPAAGFGFRYRSPLGPLRIDLGFNLDPQLLPTGSKERQTVFHLSLGQAF